MVVLEKQIWKYEKSYKSHIIEIYERNNEILVITSEGVAYIEGCERALNFIIRYAQKKDRKVPCLLDNSKLHTIDSGVKLLFLRFQEINNHVNKMAIVGNNHVLKQYGKTFKYTCNFKYPIRDFDNKLMAISWLKK